MQRVPLLIGGAVVVAAAGLAWVWQETTPSLPRAERPYPSVVRAPVSDEANAFRLVTAAAKRLRYPEQGRDEFRSSLRKAVAAPRPLAPQHLAFLRANRPAVEALHAARGRAAFQVTVPPIRFDSPIPRFRDVQALSRLGLLAFRERLAAGDGPAARAHLVDVLHLARRMVYAAGEPIVVPMLGAATLRLAHDAIARERAPLFALSSGELQALLADLNQMDAMERPLAELLVAERDALVDLLENTDRVARKIDDGAGDHPGAAAKMLPIGGPLMAPHVRGVWDASIEAAVRRDHARLRAIEAELAGTTDVRTIVGFTLHPVRASARLISSLTLPNMRDFPSLASEARFDGLRVALGAELYRRRHGRPPATLAALVPSYIAAVPQDPYQPGASLGFAGGRLWSVGPDGATGGEGDMALLPLADPT